MPAATQFDASLCSDEVAKLVEHAKHIVRLQGTERGIEAIVTYAYLAGVKAGLQQK